MAVHPAIPWTFKYAGGGVLAYVTPRLLVAAGVPIDSWIVAFGGWLSIHLAPELAIWIASFVVGILLYVTGVYFSREHPWGVRSLAELPISIFDRVWPKVEPHLISIGLAIVLIGAAIVGYAAYSQKNQNTELRIQLGAIEEELKAARQPPPQLAIESVPPKLEIVEKAERLDRLFLLSDSLEALRGRRSRLTHAIQELKGLYKSLKPPPSPLDYSPGEVTIGRKEQDLHRMVGIIDGIFENCYGRKKLLPAMQPYDEDIDKRVPGETEMPDERRAKKFRELFYREKHLSNRIAAMMSYMNKEIDDLRRAIPAHKIPGSDEK